MDSPPPPTSSTYDTLRTTPEWKQAQRAMQQGDWLGALVFIEQLLKRSPE